MESIHDYTIMFAAGDRNSICANQEHSNDYYIERSTNILLTTCYHHVM